MTDDRTWDIALAFAYDEANGETIDDCVEVTSLKEKGYLRGLGYVFLTEILMDLKNEKIRTNELREKLARQAEVIQRLEKSRASLRRNNKFLQQKIHSMRKGINRLRNTILGTGK